ncbi:MAG: glycoside hydrolase family 31 protein [Deltaproteobacteria bacterium]|nr:glycoside hydrolase family 31 protein [Deltaproteobacteria bacterium]
MSARLRALLATVFLLLSACGGSDTATVPTPSPTRALTATQASTATFAPTTQPTSTSTFVATNRPTASPSSTPTATRTSTSTPTAVPTAAPVEVSSGRFSVVFDPTIRALTLYGNGATPLLTFPADGLQLGRVDKLEEPRSYDPYSLYVAGPDQRPPGLRWLSVVSASVSSVDEAGRFVARLGYEEGQSAQLDVQLGGDGRFVLQWKPTGSDPVAYFRLRPRADASEGFYGLGEYFDDVNHRGKLRAMQIELDTQIESSYNEAHVPIPFLIGTKGWGLFVETYYPGTFDVARQANDLVEATFGTGSASSQGLTFHLFAAEHPLDVTKHYYEVTGFPRLPARWALGPWIWRDENRDQTQFENDLNTLRDLDLATTAVWIDRPYASGVNTFDFNPPQFPDPPHMVALAHQLGLRMALWHTPYLDRMSPATKTLRDYAAQHGFYPPHSSILFNGWGRPIDLTNPDAFAWWQSLIHMYTDAGIEGFKLDYGEDVVAGLSSARNVWSFADGSDERTMHEKFQLFYHRVYAETLPADGGFLLCRHGAYGDQRNGPIIWPGDLDASFAKHREVVQDGNTSYVAVGGLPASMISGIGLGASGFPFYASDTGGYRHSPPDKELFTRWFEQTALSSVMEIGTSTNDVAWEPTPENGFDAEMLDWYRRYTRLHLRLWPYVWTYAQRIAQDGRPIERPVGLAYPELGQHPWDEYLLGDDLLVAPVVERGQRQRQVILPPGDWVNWWTGERVNGTITVEAPLDTLPLFQRAGSIIPLLRPTIDAIAATSDVERVDSYATTPGLVYARVLPEVLKPIAYSSTSTFRLFDGTVLGQKFDVVGAPFYPITLTYKPGTDFQSGAIFELSSLQFPGVPTSQAPNVSDNGSTVPRASTMEDFQTMDSGWFYDGSLYIKVAGGEHTVDAQFDIPEVALKPPMQ